MTPTVLDNPVTSESKTRTLNIREVANGYVLRLEIYNPKAEGTTASGFISQELVVMNLPSLLKKVKTFFEPILVEETGE